MTMNRQQPGDPAWLVEALKLDGIKETPGAKHTPEVVALFKDAGHAGVKDDETAWCAAFVGATLRRAGYLSTGTLLARDYLKFGQKVTKPKRGDIVVFPRGNSTWQGHVGFVAGIDENYVYVLGGNQANAVNVTRYSRAKALGFRRPVAMATIADIQTRLRALGFVQVGEIDGIVGEKTTGAIAAFEKANGLSPSSDATVILDRLRAAAGSAQAPKPAERPNAAPAKDTAQIEPYEEGIAEPPRSKFPWAVILAIAAVAALAAFGLWPTE